MGAVCMVRPLPGPTVLFDIGSTYPNGTVPLLGGEPRHVGKPRLEPGRRFKASLYGSHSGSPSDQPLDAVHYDFRYNLSL
jgi:hypothetical protein